MTGNQDVCADVYFSAYMLPQHTYVQPISLHTHPLTRIPQHTHPSTHTSLNTHIPQHTHPPSPPPPKYTQLLEAFFHLWLESEGDVRRLALLGYRVHYTQTPQQEYDLTFNNLQIDLRDGMRLCKLAELLTGKKGVMAGARVPAVSRVHHMANVAAALRVLQNSGLDLMVGVGVVMC